MTLRYVAFTTDPAGGNPAGVELEASGLSADDMQRIAAGIGYSETAFVVPRGDRDLDVRYFSPLIEVPFCGHATIATAVAYAERNGVGPLTLHTAAGLIEVSTATDAAGAVVATLVSVPPRVTELDPATVAELLAALRWAPEDLDPAFPIRLAYAGARHPIVAAATRDRLAALDYDRDRLLALMRAGDWITIDLVWRESADVFHARNPFPVGGVYEDPATGAAAAAFGGYLRELGLVQTPGTVTVHQGDDMGRPSLITVGIPAEGGVSVTGTAVAL